MRRPFERILVTGGAGFVGSTLSIAIKTAFPKADIWALDNLRRRGSELNLPRLNAAGVRFVHGDIRNREDLPFDSDLDLIVECSAEPSAQAGYSGSPEYLFRTNVDGCFNCLDLARICRAALVFLSTSRVYPYATLNRLPYYEEGSRFSLCEEQPLPGASKRGIAESFPLTGPRSLYGMTKLAAELMIEEYSDAYGVEYVINRFGLLTGPWQMAKSDQGVIALWVAAHHFKRGLAYIGFGGTGKQVRDFLHIQDACDLIIDQIKHFDLYVGKTLNAGGGLINSLSLRETTALCEEITGNSIPMGSKAENRPADVRIYISDHSAVTSLNGWMPRRDARTTLGDIHCWVRREEHALKSVM
jgi:CDP-paratose 2-epimerase